MTLTVPVAENIWRVRLVGDFLHAFIIRAPDGSVMFVDTGGVFTAQKLLQALTDIGSGPSDVTHILCSHGHSDHIGGAAKLVDVTAAPVLAHPSDAPFLTGGRPTPTDHSTLLGRLAALMPGAKPLAVSQTFEDQDKVGVAGGLKVFHTPGHSPGHCSFLHEPTGVLLVGDAIFNMRSLTWPVKYFCSDFRLTQRSAQRLVTFDYDCAAFCHGPPLAHNPKKHIGKFLLDQGF